MKNILDIQDTFFHVTIEAFSYYKRANNLWGVSLFHNRLILTPFHMSLTSSKILLSLIDNRSIYTPCHMSLSLSEILQRLPLAHVSIIVQVPAIALRILFRDLVVMCMHASVSSAWTLARWQPAVNQFYFLQRSDSST